MSRQSSYEKDTSAVKKVEELEGEQKSDFLKRVARETRALQKGNKVTEEYFVIRAGMGARNKPIKKLLKVTRKSNGGKYTSYICRADKLSKEELSKLDIRPE